MVVVICDQEIPKKDDFTYIELVAHNGADAVVLLF